MKRFCFATVAMVMLAASATAGPVSFTNGSFESTSNGLGLINYGDTQATGWYVPNGGYTFIFDAAAANGAGVSNTEYAGGLVLWGAGNGGLDTITASPDGGNFIAQDGVYEQSPIDQSISGLTVGATYTAGFYYAAAQQNGDTGATTNLWSVKLGDSAAQSTPVVDLPGQSFSGWYKETFRFVADNATDVLSFQGVGSGAPAFALLDGVTFTSAVPEPATWTVTVFGFFLIGGLARRRRSAPLLAA